MEYRNTRFPLPMMRNFKMRSCVSLLEIVLNVYKLLLFILAVLCSWFPLRYLRVLRKAKRIYIK